MGREMIVGSCIVLSHSCVFVFSFSVRFVLVVIFLGAGDDGGDHIDDDVDEHGDVDDDDDDGDDGDDDGDGDVDGDAPTFRTFTPTFRTFTPTFRRSSVDVMHLGVCHCVG